MVKYINMTEGERKFIQILDAIKRYQVVEIKLGDKNKLEVTKKTTEKFEIDLHGDEDRV